MIKRLPARAPLLVSMAGFWVATMGLFRVFLFAVFAPDGSGAMAFAHAMFVGLRLDLAAASWFFLPLALWLCVLPDRAYRSKFHRGALRGAFVLWATHHWFNFAMEYFFFEEFQSRYNNVSVDYLLYPHEVFVNIWESYPVVPFVLVCLLLGAGTYLAFRGMFFPEGEPATTLKTRAKELGVYLACGLVFTQSVGYNSARFGDDRVIREIALNGPYAFAWAAWSRELDYRGFYKTMDLDAAYARTRALLAEPGVEYVEDGRSIRRRVPAGPGWAKKKKNLVIVLVESFGSEFMVSLGREGESFAPRMDAMKGKSVFFTDFYATGNRTVRGLEGTLAAFPPLPGDSIVKRKKSSNVATVGRVLRDHGYETMFLYGGVALFDGMRRFTSGNGFDRIVEQVDFEDPVFKTIWGVSDEDILNRAIEEFRRLERVGKPWHTTILTVSNHKPYTYPEGRIDKDPNAHSRHHAVKYTDWALGEFLDKLKKEPYWDDTVVAVLADHGARVYGSPAIPIHSYECPWIITGGGVAAKTVGTLASHVDVAPTLLGMLGAPYVSTFFGRDVFKTAASAAFVPMNHNRDVGLMRDGKMVVLGLQRIVEYWNLDPKTRDLVRAEKTPAHEELEKDAVALFQVADDLYVHENYNVPAR